MAISDIEHAIGYQFRDAALAERAFTHRSYANEQRVKAESKERGDNGDNERLEFLGDAVLGVAVAEALFFALQGCDEGELSLRKGYLVSQPSLESVARKLGLGGALLLGIGEERSGGRDKPNVLADAFEALVGAVYADGGFAAARGVIERTLLAGGAVGEAGVQPRDFKTRLQEMAHTARLPIPEYRLAEERGPAHQRLFVVDVVWNGAVVARGEGGSKKSAEQLAARLALETLEGNA